MEAAQAPQLRPLALGEVLDVAFKVYGRRFKTLAMCVLVPTVPLLIIQTLLVLSVNETAFEPDASAEEVDGTEGAALAALGVTVLLGNLVFWAAVAACVRVIAGAYLSEDVSWQASLKFGLRRMLPLLGLVFLWFTLGFLTLPLVLFGVFLFIRWGVVIPARLVEDAKWFSSLGRSWKLVGGRWWVTFALYFLMVVIWIIMIIFLPIFIVTPAAATGSVAAALAVNLVGGVAVSVVTYPLLAAIVTIHYFDLRVRKEGFDLQLLARNVGSGAGPADVAHASGLGGYEAPGAPASPGGFSAPQAPEERGIT